MISYRFNDDGKKVKTTRRIRTTVVKEHVNPRVAERKGWAKFGLEKGHPPGPSLDTTSVGENIIFRPSINWKSLAKEAEKDGGEKGGLKDQLKDKKVKCRICSGEHFTARCPYKDTMAPVDEPSGAAGGDNEEEEKAPGGLGASGSTYVPPALRRGGGGGGGGGGEKMGSKYERDELATLRVTNVSLCRACTAIWDHGNAFWSLTYEHRSANLPKNRIFEICLADLDMSPESSLQRIKRRIWPRALRSSALRTDQMPPELVKRWMAVSR